MDIFSRRLTGRSFLKIITPTTVSMLFISFYTVVDGLFVGRFVGENALAAVNIAFPVLSVIFGFSVMLGSGGSAIVGALLGRQKIKEAKENFALIVAAGIFTGLVLSLLFISFIKPIVILLGASDALYRDCYDYVFIIALAAPFIILNDILEIFMRTDGSAGISLGLAVFGGILNIILDYILIVQYGLGIAGAAWGTAISFIVPSFFATFYFAKKSRILRFVKPVFNLPVLLKTCSNGLAEMVTRFSTAFTTFLFNIMTMKYLGEAGVAAISVILYAQFLMISVYLGFSFGCAPLISYNYGARDKEQLRKTMRYSGNFLLVSSAIIFVFSMLGAPYIVAAFVGRGTEVFAIATGGMRIYSFCFLFIGFNIFTSAMFTAFSNGRVSAAISLMHSVVFLFAGITLLPLLFGVDGIWLAMPAAEAATLGLSWYCVKKHKDVYGY